MISIKILLVISMLYKTDWWWDLRTWSHKTQWVDTSTTSHYSFYNKRILGATNENSNFDLRVQRVKVRFRQATWPWNNDIRWSGHKWHKEQSQIQKWISDRDKKWKNKWLKANGFAIQTTVKCLLKISMKILFHHQPTFPFI